MVALDSLVWDVTMEAWKKNLLSSMASLLRDILNQKAVILVSIIGRTLAINVLLVLMLFIGRYGKRIMGLFPRVAIFIILMVIHSITPLIIWNALLRKSIQLVTNPNFMISAVSMPSEYARLPKNGTHHQRVLRGILSMVKIAGKIDNQYKKFVPNAGKSMNRWLRARATDFVHVAVFHVGMSLTSGTMRIGCVSLVVHLLVTKSLSLSKPALVSVVGLFVVSVKAQQKDALASKYRGVFLLTPVCGE